MDAEIRYEGQDYFIVARRFHLNRSNPQMKPTAVRDMERVLMATPSASVRQRCLSFINKHRRQPPGGPSNGGGPRYA
jgi:hypothetical protein